LGLGLLIVKKLVDTMGRKMEVKSEVNVGTSLTAFLSEVSTK